VGPPGGGKAALYDAIALLDDRWVYNTLLVCSGQCVVCRACVMGVCGGRANKFQPSCNPTGTDRINPNPPPPLRPPPQNRATIARAEDVAADFLEAFGNIDAPRRYFDALPRAKASGAQNAEFVRFSAGALARCSAKLGEFFALMPRAAMADARAAAAGAVEQ
jgi:hypothetical protein